MGGVSETDEATRSPSLESLKGLKGAEYRKAWNKLNRDRMKEVNKAWSARNPGKDRARIQAWHNKNPGKRNAQRGDEKYYAGHEKAKSKGQPWGVVEDYIVMDSGEPDKIIAEKLGRSVKAVEIRRCRLKKQNLLEPCLNAPTSSQF